MNERQTPVYRRGKLYAARVARLIKAAEHPQLRQELSPEEQAILSRMRITETQFRCLEGYYCRGRNMAQLSEEFGIHVSSVCRAISRGEDNLRTALEQARKEARP